MEQKFLNLWKSYSYYAFLSFIVLGIIDLRFALIAIVCMIAPIAFAINGKGRYWCGNFCPRGNFFDNIMRKFSKKNSVPKFFKNTIFRTIVIMFMFSMFGTGIYKNWGNLPGIGMVFYRIIVVTSLIGIFLTLLYNERSWCSFCPMGSIGSFIAKFKGKKVKMQVENTCVSCNLCSKKCPMDISPKDFKGAYIEDTDCILCGKCSITCPKNSITLKKSC